MSDTAQGQTWWQRAEEELEDVVEWIEDYFNPNKPTPPIPPLPPGPGPPPVVVPDSAGTIAWVNDDPNTSARDFAKWVTVCADQVPHIQALWPHVKQWQHIVVPDTAHVPSDAVPAHLRSQLDIDGALGYHDVDSRGKPLIEIGGDVTRQYGEEISMVMSHEAWEVTVDPSCQLSAVAPNGDVWDLEACDPCESDKDPTADGNASDGVGQAFFNKGPGNLDQVGAITAAFTLASGGYAVINGRQVFAAKAERKTLHPMWAHGAHVKAVNRSYRVK